jgi:hypothetical protein
MWNALGCLLMLTAWALPAGAAGVYWVMDPAGPDQTLLLWGEGLAGGEATGLRLADGAAGRPGPAELVRAAGEPLAAAESNPECLKLVIPAAWKPGVYVIRIAGSKTPVFVNRAQAWWVLGQQGTTAAPGGELDVFGKNFRLAPDDRPWGGTVLVRDAAGKEYRATVAAVNPYRLRLRVPEEAAEGQATVFVHNGHGGERGWSAGLGFLVARSKPWPQTAYNVRDLGARGDGLGDDTGALRAALEHCRQNGGGVVYLPRGTYRITGQLTVPARTVVRGERREVVWLYVPMETTGVRTVFAGDGDFGIEDLSMAAQTPLRMVAAPDVDSMYDKPWGRPGKARASGIFLRRLRIHHLRYAHRVGPADKDPRRLEVAGPSTVALAGERLEISGCEIVSSGMPIIIHDTRQSRIVDNDLRTGRAGWYGIWGASETIFAGNTIQGQDLEASYGAFGNYGNMPGSELSRLYLAENRFLNGYGCEREALAFDTPGDYPWVGPVRAADAAAITAEGTPWSRSFAGLACLIVRGKGLGQHRRIVSNTGSRLTVEPAWDVIPDGTSVAAILPFRRDVVIYRNHAQDASAGVELWGGGYNFIVDGNTATRTGGLWGTGAQYRARGQHVFLPCFFTQWLGNQIDESFIYQQGPEEDNSAALGLYVRNAPAGPDAGVLLVGNVIRGNRVADNTHIGLLYYGAGARQSAREAMGRRPPLGRETIIEGNTISDTPIGIHVETGFEGTLLRNNRFVRVKEPVRMAQ